MQAKCEALEARLRSAQLTKGESQRLNMELKACRTNKRIYDIHKKQWEVRTLCSSSAEHDNLNVFFPVRGNARALTS